MAGGSRQDGLFLSLQAPGEGPHPPPLEEQAAHPHAQGSRPDAGAATSSHADRSAAQSVVRLQCQPGMALPGEAQGSGGHPVRLSAES